MQLHNEGTSKQDRIGLFFLHVYFTWVYKGSTSINTRAQSGNVFLLVISVKNRINHD